jgi:hypothetical protein
MGRPRAVSGGVALGAGRLITLSPVTGTNVRWTWRLGMGTMIAMPRRRSTTFKISVKGVEWDQPFPQFSEQDAAIGYVRGVMGRLLDMGAPPNATVSVKQACLRAKCGNCRILCGASEERTAFKDHYRHRTVRWSQ